MAQQYASFRSQHKRTSVATVAKQDTSHQVLAAWCEEQRTQYKVYVSDAGTAQSSDERTKARVARLLQLGVLKLSQKQNWEVHFQMYEEYKSKYGEEEMWYILRKDGATKYDKTRGSTTYDKLRWWCEDQRARYEKYLKGKKTTLTLEMIDRLLNVGLIVRKDEEEEEASSK